MKIMIIGASGLLGGKLLEALSLHHDVCGSFFSCPPKNYSIETKKFMFYLDVTKQGHIERVILDQNPDLIIYTAAISKPDVCESNKDYAFKVNYEGVKTTASVCATLRKKLVFISSDYVFDGKKKIGYTENDKTSSINYYGRTKELAEQYINQTLPNSIIIRPSMFYGFATHSNERGFVNDVILKLKEGKSITCDDRIVKYPLLVDDVSSALLLLIESNQTGTFHMSTDVPYTKFKFACKIADTFNLDRKLIKKTIEKDIDFAARRPLDVKLDYSKIKRLGIRFSDLDAGLCIQRRQSGCSFKMIYSARPDMYMLGQNVYSFRIAIGRKLAKLRPVEGNADITVPIPETGIYTATGFAAESKYPLFLGVIRHYFAEKTLYKSAVRLRDKALREKLIAIPSIVRDKSIILIDESVLSGATLEVVIEKLKEAGVKEIHVRIGSPPFINDCTGMVLPTNLHLLVNTLRRNNDFPYELIEQKLCESFRVASFGFTPLEAFLETIGKSNELCSDCINYK